MTSDKSCSTFPANFISICHDEIKKHENQQTETSNFIITSDSLESINQLLRSQLRRYQRFTQVPKDTEILKLKESGWKNQERIKGRSGYRSEINSPNWTSRGRRWRRYRKRVSRGASEPEYSHTLSAV